MNSIFWGLIFLFFHFNFNFSAHTLSLLPNFVGYYLILKGTRETAESPTYGAMGGLLMGAVICSSALWLLDLLGIQFYGWLSLIPTGISLALQLLVTYRLVQGVRELEAVRQQDLNSRSLYQSWRVAAVLLVLSVVLVWTGRLAGVLVVGTFAAYMFYIYYIHRAKTAIQQTTGGSL